MHNGLVEDPLPPEFGIVDDLVEEASRHWRQATGSLFPGTNGLHADAEKVGEQALARLQRGTDMLDIHGIIGPRVKIERYSPDGESLRDWLAGFDSITELG